ncbi:hypothetical protein BDV93DRAFT_562735 [Ceratobasidium sp. AG-I]|nr:hypothetical protein BDV93DRAFT_562735 [Ceratobasidium sp. AG-I]
MSCSRLQSGNTPTQPTDSASPEPVSDSSNALSRAMTWARSGVEVSAASRIWGVVAGLGGREAQGRAVGSHGDWIEGYGAESYFTLCLLRTLCIISRALEIQNVLIELLIPASGYLSLDVEIASLINYQDSKEIVLLSVKLLTTPSRPACFNTIETAACYSHCVNRLLGILGRDQPDRVIEGYVRRFRIDPQGGNNGGDRSGIPLLLSDDGPDGEKIGLTQQIQSTIAEFLLANTTTGAPAPNSTHLLLGFDVASGNSGAGTAMMIQDPRAAGVESRVRM